MILINFLKHKNDINYVVLSLNISNSLSDNKFGILVNYLKYLLKLKFSKSSLLCAI